MIRTWLQSLGERERRLLAAGVLLSVAMLLFLLWRPLMATQQRLQAQVEQKQALVDWMSRATQEIGQLQPGGARSSPSGMSLQQRIDALSTRLQLDTKSFPGNGDELKVKIENTTFDPVLDFLEQAGQDGVRVIDAEIRALSAPGQVSVSLTLGG